MNVQICLLTDSKLHSQHIPFLPDPAVVLPLDLSGGKTAVDVKPLDDSNLVPTTAEHNLPYSSLWVPSNMLGSPIFGDSALGSYIEIQQPSLISSVEFTIMFWFKLDVDVNQYSVLLDIRAPVANSKGVVFWTKDGLPSVTLLDEAMNERTFTIPRKIVLFLLDEIFCFTDLMYLSKCLKKKKKKITFIVTVNILFKFCTHYQTTTNI